MAAGVEALLCIEKHTAVHVVEEMNNYEVAKLIVNTIEGRL